MTTEANKETVRRLINIINSRNLSNLDEICDEKMVYRANTEVAGSDLEAYKGLMQQTYESFPDVETSIEEIFAEGNKVHMLYKLVGTHRGEYMGIPASDQKVEHVGSSVLTLKNGTITEQHDFYDMLAFLKHLGAVSDDVRPGGDDWPTGGSKLRAR